MRILALLLVFGTAGILSAQCSLRERTVYQSYTVPEVQHHQKLYYYSGGYYYEYNGGHRGQLYYYQSGHYYRYEHHDYQYKETVILVPKAIKVEVQRDHYYSINQAARDDLLADAIVGRLLRLQATQKDVIVPKREVDKSGGEPSGPKAKGKDLGDDRAGTYQEAVMVKIIADSCAKCHGASSKFTKFTTVDGKLTDVPAGKVWEAFGLVNSGEMPKGGKSLDDDSVKAFYAWAKNARKD